MKKTIIMVFVIVGLMTSVGCSGKYLSGVEYPYTYFKINPITKSLSFEDTKNNDVTVRGLSIDSKNGVCTLAELTIKNNSSEVITADIDRVKQVVEAQKVQVDLHRVIGDNIRAAIAAGGNAAANFISKLPNLSASLDTSVGSLDLATESVGNIPTNNNISNNVNDNVSTATEENDNNG